MPKSRVKRGRAEKTVAAARFKLEGVPREEPSEETTGEIAIPDYVMYDFGDLGESSNKPDVRRRMSEARHADGTP